MKTILYATDYSENSVAALHFAYALRREFNAELVVLHAFELPFTLASTVSFTYSRKEVKAFGDHRNKLMAFCTEHLKNEPEPLKITWKIDEGKPASDSIIKQAKELAVDLIVVGAKGGSLIREVLLGSNTTALINAAPCPVLAIPEDTDFQGIKNIVYTTDFEGDDIFTIEKMVKLAEPYDADIHLVHVSAKETDTIKNQMEWFKEMLHNRVEYDNIKFELHYGKDVFVTLQEYMYEIEPDMIVMLERSGKGLIKSLGHQDFVKRMKTEAHFPLLTFHKKNI